MNGRIVKRTRLLPVFKRALQLLMLRYEQICVAQVPERVWTKSFRRFDCKKLKVEWLRLTGHFQHVTSG